MTALENYLYKLPLSPKERGVVAIYAVVDPRNKEVRYIGQSNTPSTRKEAHAMSRGDLGAWMQGLIQVGIYPEMAIIEEVAPDIAMEREQYFISYYLQNGAKLFNTTDFSKSRGGKYELSIEHMSLLASGSEVNVCQMRTWGHEPDYSGVVLAAIYGKQHLIPSEWGIGVEKLNVCKIERNCHYSGERNLKSSLRDSGACNWKPNQRVNLTGKSYAPFVAPLSPTSYPYRYTSDSFHSYIQIAQKQVISANIIVHKNSPSCAEMLIPLASNIDVTAATAVLNKFRFSIVIFPLMYNNRINRDARFTRAGYARR